MRPRVDLHLVGNALRQLNDAAYFEPQLRAFTAHFVAAIDHVLDNRGLYDAKIEASFAGLARQVQSYLSGSTSNETPFEVVYCLKDVLARWGLGDAVIATFLTEGHDFHLKPLDPWHFIEQSITNYDAGDFNLVVAMIGVPRIYAHKPIFCVPLFHELGHFIDIGRYRISQTSMVRDKTPIAPVGSAPITEFLHRAEHFADLFAASIVGRSSIAALETIALGNPASDTHPSTADRVAVVEAFLSGASNPIVDTLQSALKARGQPQLVPIFESVDVDADFDDLRTFVPKSIEQVFGLFDSAWGYLFEAIDTQRNPWGLTQIKEGDIERISNDLTEKSIRNFAIRQAWNAASSSP